MEKRKKKNREKKSGWGKKKEKIGGEGENRFFRSMKLKTSQNFRPRSVFLSSVSFFPPFFRGCPLIGIRKTVFNTRNLRELIFFLFLLFCFCSFFSFQIQLVSLKDVKWMKQWDTKKQKNESASFELPKLI